MTKPTKWLMRPAKTLISLDTQSDQSIRCSHEGALGPELPIRHSELWSDWADAQADLSLCWVHRSSCWFCHAAAHVIVIPSSFTPLNCFLSQSTVFQASRGIGIDWIWRTWYKWMDEKVFTSYSTVHVFQSYWDDGRVNMKGSVQWSAV